MSHHFIATADLRQWLSDLVTSHTVIAPLRRGSETVFHPIESADEIAWDAGRTDFSAKDFFLPASEAIVRWQVVDGEVAATASRLERPQVLFGARPCDAHALEVLDRLFLRDPVDPYYAERRSQTTLVGVACTDGPWDGCFCTSVGGSPTTGQHLDLLLTHAEGGYAVEAVTPKGETLLAHARLAARDDPRPTSRPEVSPLQVAGADNWRAHFSDAYWAELAERCLGCRTCTYDCPVCYCFDVRDRRLSDGSIERLRCWDSCQGAQCFAIAGGHNPRPTQASRLRQRYMHKFLYYPTREGEALCVGCGRCVVQCPVNIDIREVLAHVASPRGATLQESRP